MCCRGAGSTNVIIATSACARCFSTVVAKPTEAVSKYILRCNMDSVQIYLVFSRNSQLADDVYDLLESWRAVSAS